MPQRPRRRRSEEHTSELQSRGQLVCRLLLEKKKHVCRDRNSRLIAALRAATTTAASPSTQQDARLRGVQNARYFFSFNAPSPPDTYTLSLHDALPISRGA